MSSISLSLTIYILLLHSYYPAEMVVIKLPYTVQYLPCLCISPLALAHPLSPFLSPYLISPIDQTLSAVCSITSLSLLSFFHVLL